MKFFSRINLGLSDIDERFTFKKETTETVFQVCYESVYTYIIFCYFEQLKEKPKIEMLKVSLSSTVENEITIQPDISTRISMMTMIHLLKNTRLVDDVTVSGGSITFVNDTSREMDRRVFEFVFSYIGSFWALRCISDYSSWIFDVYKENKIEGLLEVG